MKNTASRVRFCIGCLTLLSVILAVWVSQWWLLLTVFISVGLIQSAFTEWCPMEKMLKKYCPKCKAENGTCEIK